MKAETRHPASEARSRKAAPAASCMECPVCGSEECLVLEELGTYCATMMAAGLSRAEKVARAEKDAGVRA